MLPHGTLSGSAAEPFFITIEKVELKNDRGAWVTVIEPDRRVDLASEEPMVSFFNNGRIEPGQYTNVRVSLMAEETARREVFLERLSDYEPPVPVKKGSFVNISFAFDLEKKPAKVTQENIRQIHLTVDEAERIDSGDTIKIWS